MDPTRLDRIARQHGAVRTRRGLLRAVVGAAAARATVGTTPPAAEAALCTFDGGLCPVGCGWGQSCPECCGGRCGSGVCASGFAGCTGSGCACAVGQLFGCGVGLTCCSVTGTSFSGGTCQFFCPSQLSRAIRMTTLGS